MHGPSSEYFFLFGGKDNLRFDFVVRIFRQVFYDVKVVIVIVIAVLCALHKYDSLKGNFCDKLDQVVSAINMAHSTRFLVFTESRHLRLSISDYVGYV